MGGVQDGEQQVAWIGVRLGGVQADLRGLSTVSHPSGLGSRSFTVLVKAK